MVVVTVSFLLDAVIVLGFVSSSLGLGAAPHPGPWQAARPAPIALSQTGGRTLPLFSNRRQPRLGLGDQGPHGAEGEVQRERDQGQADDPLGGGLDPLGPLRLAGLHAEPPDQDDRGDRVDHRVGAEASSDRLPLTEAA